MSYTTDAAIRWAERLQAPHRHDEALYAITNAHYVEKDFDVPHFPGHVRPTLLIGPNRLGGRVCQMNGGRGSA